MKMIYPTVTSMDDIGMLLQESFFNNNDEYPLHDISHPDDNIEEHFGNCFLIVLMPLIIKVRILWKNNLKN